jgi:hypothetical protein
MPDHSGIATDAANAVDADRRLSANAKCTWGNAVTTFYASISNRTTWRFFWKLLTFDGPRPYLGYCHWWSEASGISLSRLLARYI